MTAKFLIETSQIKYISSKIKVIKNEVGQNNIKSSRIELKEKEDSRFLNIPRRTSPHFGQIYFYLALHMNCNCFEFYNEAKIHSVLVQILIACYDNMYNQIVKTKYIRKQNKTQTRLHKGS